MSNIEENPITELQAEWLAVLKACESSGQSMAAYARANNLVVKDLYKWKQVLVTKGISPRTQSVRFVKATIKKKPNHENECRVVDRKSTRLNSSHTDISRMPSSA